MKTACVALFALAAADEKNRLQRLNKLNTFAAEWVNDNLSAKQAFNWGNKFANNVARFEARYRRCGFYDENQLPHGGPLSDARKRRDAVDEDDADFERYNKNEPLVGIKQITNGFRKWAQRYLADSSPVTGAKCAMNHTV